VTRSVEVRWRLVVDSPVLTREEADAEAQQLANKHRCPVYVERQGEETRRFDPETK
jgi:hypothetical protein